jgi:hypothetical protein
MTLVQGIRGILRLTASFEGMRSGFMRSAALISTEARSVIFAALKCGEA